MYKFNYLECISSTQQTDMQTDNRFIDNQNELLITTTYHWNEIIYIRSTSIQSKYEILFENNPFHLTSHSLYQLVSLHRIMLILITLMFMITAKAKEETSIVRRIFDDDIPENIRKGMMEQFAEAKLYHQNGNVIPFDEYYKKKLAEQQSILDSIMNIRKLYQVWTLSQQTDELTTNTPFFEFYKIKLAEQKLELYKDAKKQDIYKEWLWYKQHSDKLLRQQDLVGLDEDIQAIEDCRNIIREDHTVEYLTTSVWMEVFKKELFSFDNRMKQKILKKDTIYHEWSLARLDFDEYINNLRENNRLKELGSDENIREAWREANQETNFVKYFKKIFEKLKASSKNVQDEITLYRKYQSKAFHMGKFVSCSPSFL